MLVGVAAYSTGSIALPNEFELPNIDTTTTSTVSIGGYPADVGIFFQYGDVKVNYNNPNAPGIVNGTVGVRLHNPKANAPVYWKISTVNTDPVNIYPIIKTGNGQSPAVSTHHLNFLKDYPQSAPITKRIVDQSLSGYNSGCVPRNTQPSEATDSPLGGMGFCFGDTRDLKDTFNYMINQPGIVYWSFNTTTDGNGDSSFTVDVGLISSSICQILRIQQGCGQGPLAFFDVYADVQGDLDYAASSKQTFEMTLACPTGSSSRDFPNYPVKRVHMQFKWDDGTPFTNLNILGGGPNNDFRVQAGFRAYAISYSTQCQRIGAGGGASQPYSGVTAWADMPFLDRNGGYDFYYDPNFDGQLIITAFDMPTALWYVQVSGQLEHYNGEVLFAPLKQGDWYGMPLGKAAGYDSLEDCNTIGPQGVGGGTTWIYAGRCKSFADWTATRGGHTVQARYDDPTAFPLSPYTTDVGGGTTVSLFNGIEQSRGGGAHLNIFSMPTYLFVNQPSTCPWGCWSQRLGVDISASGKLKASSSGSLNNSRRVGPIDIYGRLSGNWATAYLPTIVDADPNVLASMGPVVSFTGVYSRNLIGRFFNRNGGGTDKASIAAQAANQIANTGGLYASQNGVISIGAGTGAIVKSPSTGDWTVLQGGTSADWNAWVASHGGIYSTTNPTGLTIEYSAVYQNQGTFGPTLPVGAKYNVWSYNYVTKVWTVTTKTVAAPATVGSTASSGSPISRYIAAYIAKTYGATCDAACKADAQSIYSLVPVTVIMPDLYGNPVYMSVTWMPTTVQGLSFLNLVPGLLPLTQHVSYIDPVTGIQYDYDIVDSLSPIASLPQPVNYSIPQLGIGWDIIVLWVVGIFLFWAWDTKRWIFKR